jgi:hypothetical protein
VEKIAQQNLYTCVIFKKLPKENNHPIGENAPNLVTLVAGPFHNKERCFENKR